MVYKALILFALFSYTCKKLWTDLTGSPDNNMLHYAYNYCKYRWDCRRLGANVYGVGGQETHLLPISPPLQQKGGTDGGGRKRGMR